MEIIVEDKESEFLPPSHLHLPMQSQIALMFMAVMLIFAVFASLLNSLIVSNNFEEKLDKEAGQYIQFIFNGYLENINDLKNYGFESNLRRILRDEYMMSISLYDKDKNLILGIGQESTTPESVFASDNKTLSIIKHNDIHYYRYLVPVEFQNDYSSKKNIVKKNDQEKNPKNSKGLLNYIVLIVDGNFVFRKALNAFVWTFLFTMLAAICMMFIAIVVIRNFSRPFDELSMAMRKAQLGDRGVEIVPNGASEIYSMGVAFNSMISVLERREDKLLTQKKSLEDEIKERKSAEVALQNITLSLQAIFQNAVDGIVVVNKEYKIVSINPSAEHIYAYGEGELVGESFSKIMQEHFIKVIFGTCEEHGSSVGDNNYHSLALTKSGEQIPVEMGVSIMALSEEEAYLVMVRDISQRIKVENELNNYQTHLESMVKEQTKDIASARDAAMAGERAMSTFLANMSHEIRTPMHGVLSYASIALKKIDLVDTEKTKEYLYEIKNSGAHLLEIINDLLDLSKMKSGKMVYNYIENSFVNVIESMNREMAGLASDKGVVFDFEVQGEDIGFPFDNKRMMQVMRNLYANAIKFSHSNVPIKIIADYREEGFFIFSIFNFGVIVPDDESDTIFDNFTQSSQTVTNAGGTGLGLPICKQIVESGHAGKIWSEPGIENGSRFIMKIPMSIKIYKKKSDKNEGQHF